MDRYGLKAAFQSSAHMNMRIFRLPIYIDSDAALKKAVTAWSTVIQDRIKTKHGERFNLNWTFTWSNSDPASASSIPGYNEEIALTENGRPYARIVLRSPAGQPRAIECELESCAPPIKPASAVMGLVAILAALAAFGGWVYYLFFGGGWGRAVERFSHLGQCRDCATKLEIFFLFVGGWLAVPVMVAVPFYMLGQVLDELINNFRNKLALRKLVKQLLPDLEQTLRDIQQTAATDSRFATFPVVHQVDGTPHEKHPNVVWDGKGNLRPVTGYTWAEDDVASYAVKLKEGAPDV
jgi:hypothetical protein